MVSPVEEAVDTATRGEASYTGSVPGSGSGSGSGESRRSLAVRPFVLDLGFTLVPGEAPEPVGYNGMTWSLIRERDRKTERQRDRERERQTDRDRETETKTKTERQRDREIERDRDRDRKTERQR